MQFEIVTIIQTVTTKSSVIASEGVKIFYVTPSSSPLLGRKYFIFVSLYRSCRARHGLDQRQLLPRRVGGRRTLLRLQARQQDGHLGQLRRPPRSHHGSRSPSGLRLCRLPGALLGLFFFVRKCSHLWRWRRHRGFLVPLHLAAGPLDALLDGFI